jgi:hypothetical protein
MTHKKKTVYLGTIIVTILTLACFQMAFVMTDGLAASGNSIAERHEFIQNNLGIWQLGWLNWMLAALGLLTFCCLLLPYIPSSEWRLLGILLVALGIAPDLSAEIIFAFIIPYSHQIDPSLATMQMLEALAMQLTGTLGNGLYNIGGFLLNALLLSNKKLPRKLVLIGLPGWCFGFGLSIACATYSMETAKFFTAAGMVWSTVWMFAITLIVFRKSDNYRLEH